jgi:succinyl-CoA synthetase beta subunit
LLGDRIKAQVHAGGRGKGGGVILCHDVEAVENACGKLLGSQLITPQTDAKGLPVNQLLIEAALLAALVLAIKTPLGVLILLRLNNVLA